MDDLKEEIRFIILRLINHYDFTYIIIETKFTIHYFERVSYKDRGKIKWIANTKDEYCQEHNMNDERLNSHINWADLFPRLYFLSESFLNEFFAWLDARGLVVTRIKNENEVFYDRY